MCFQRVTHDQKERDMTASEGVEITGPDGDRYDEILTPGALGLIASLEREFGPRRAELLAARAARQEELSAGGMLDFLPGTQQIRQDTAWRVAPLAEADHVPSHGALPRRLDHLDDGHRGEGCRQPRRSGSLPGRGSACSTLSKP